MRMTYFFQKRREQRGERRKNTNIKNEKKTNSEKKHFSLLSPLCSLLFLTIKISEINAQNSRFFKRDFTCSQKCENTAFYPIST